MKTISILSKISIRLTVALILQQIAYGIYYNSWIDFSTWSATTLGFELLFILSVVFSTIEDVTVRAVRPMKSQIKRDIPENTFTPKEN